ncbi:MAG: serine--tRNA ligase [Deltaproteobacteria bacterium]|nr:MAG: serine--tRNA ligase [Deltaproteobacteria bacterium]
MPWSVLRTLRTNPDLMKENLRKRFMDPGLVDEFLRVDAEWRKLQTELNKLRHEHNVISSRIAKARPEERSELIAKAKELLKEIGEYEVRLKEAEARRKQILNQMPSLLHESVPIGPDDSYNAVVRVWGKALVQRKHLKDFLAETEGKGVRMEYEVTDREIVGHADMLENVLRLGDTLKAGEVAGSRFYYLFDDLVWLDMALLSYAIDYLTSKGFKLVLPPYFLKGKYMRAVEEFEAFKDALYKIDGEDLYLIATAEHPLAALHAGEAIPEEELPLLYVGVSPCFRKEAGAANRDIKGIFRVHQFHKVEQFAYTLPEQSWEVFDLLIGNAEELYRGLGIPFRVVNIASGELNLRAAMKYDLEAWYPAQGKFRELVSCSNVLDWQAYKLNVKYLRRKGMVRDFVHMLNSTAIASTRTITAILENYQREDGVVEIPKVLRKYLEPFSKAPKDYIYPRKKA